MSRIVEIAHVYHNEPYQQGSLEYLKNFRLRDDDNLIVFIDDYSFEKHPQFRLGDITHDLKFFPKFDFESNMVKYAPVVVSYLSDNFLITENSNGVFAEGVKISHDDRPTCFLLSLTWTMYRAGFFYNDPSEVLTIISKKYKKLEERVERFLPSSIKDRCSWIFV